MRALSLLAAFAFGCGDFGLNSPADDEPGDVAGSGGDGGAGGDGGGWGDGGGGWGPPSDGSAQIVLWPDPFDFGDHATGCSEGAFDWYVQNVGDEPLEIAAFSLDDATWEVTFEVPAFPTTLAPGEVIEGSAAWVPEVDGAPGGSFWVYSNDPLAPAIERPLGGSACADMDLDGLCDDEDDDRDGDGAPDDTDRYPDLVTLDDAHVDFDDLAAGTRILEQYADLGVHFEGEGAPGQGYDTNVVQPGSACTQAVLETSPNVLCTYVNDGFNHSGEPGLSGWLDSPADAVTVRMYNAGHAYAAANGADRDQAELVTYDAAGVEIGRHLAVADTDAGDEYVDLVVLGEGAMSFALFTGDFDAVDDLHVLRLEAPACAP